jgi:protein-S-isoprenylcysteine O-methyltransferase Ste14
MPKEPSSAIGSANVAVFPPLLLAFCIALGLGFWFAIPSLSIPLPVAVPLAIVCGVSGLLLDQWAQRSMREAHPSGCTSTIVTTGAFAFSRNPIYVAHGLLLACVGFALHRPLFFLALVPWYIVVRYGVVSREERYLMQVFGKQYLDYQAKVRRWL